MNGGKEQQFVMIQSKKNMYDFGAIPVILLICLGSRLLAQII